MYMFASTACQPSQLLTPISRISLSGQSDLTEVVFGAQPVRGGRMELEGKPYSPSTPAQALAAGVGFLDEDR